MWRQLQEAKDSDVKLEEKPKVPPPVNRRKPQTRNKASQQIPYSIVSEVFLFCCCLRCILVILHHPSNVVD